MREFKTVEKLGLTVYALPDVGFVVCAGDLESLLQSAQVVKRKKGDRLWTEDFTVFKFEPDEQGILLCVEPIKKKTKAEAALEYVELMAGLGSVKAKRILEMKDNE